jgi:hypothetical protein
MNPYLFSGIDPDGLLSWCSWVMKLMRKWELEGLEVEQGLVGLVGLEDLEDLADLMRYVIKPAMKFVPENLSCCIRIA